MVNENKKGVLITIIVLLCIFIPGTILGIVGKSMKDNAPAKEQSTSENDKQELLYNDTLHFYNYGILLGTYDCSEGYIYCGYAYEYVDDNTYHLDYYDDNTINQLGIIGEKYAFISDTKSDDEYYRNDGVILYDIVNKKALVTYQAVKNYTIGIENDLYIVKNNNKWGIIKLTGDIATTILDPSYDYIGLQNSQNNNLIVSDQFVVMNDGVWGIIDINGARLSGTFNSEIASYNGNNLIVVNGSGKYELYSYQGANLLDNNVYNKLIFVGKYVGVYGLDNNFYIYDYVNKSIISSKYVYTNVDDVQIEFKDNNALIKKDGQVLESISLV